MENENQQTIAVSVSAQCSHSTLDLSGQLPFQLKLWLVRRTKSDHEPRSLTILVPGSLLDIPYALKCGVLKIYETQPWGVMSDDAAPLDFSDLELKPSVEFLTLDSPVGENLRDFDRYVSFGYSVDADSAIAQRFEANKTYRIVLPNDGHDFPVDWCSLEGSSSYQPSLSSRPGIHIKRTGHTPNVSFTTVQALAWPPQVTVSLSFPSTATPAIFSEKGPSVIQASLTNTGSRSVTIQTRGDQRFVLARDRLQNLVPDDRPRISAEKCREDVFLVVDEQSGEVKYKWRPPICTLRLRERGPYCLPRDAFVTLEPGVPLVRDVELNRLRNLSPGDYRLYLETLSCWWTWATVDELFGSDTEIAMSSQKLRVPPLELASTNELKFTVSE